MPGRMRGATRDQMTFTRTIPAPSATARGIQVASAAGAVPVSAGSALKPRVRPCARASWAPAASTTSSAAMTSVRRRTQRLAQPVRRRRTSVRTAAASTLPIRAIGSNGPSPPPPVEPLSALRTLVDGDDPWPPDVGALDSRRAPPEWPAGRARRGAVAAASAAVASPVGPCLARARWVDAAIAPPPGGARTRPSHRAPRPRRRRRGGRCSSVGLRPRSALSPGIGRRPSFRAERSCGRALAPRMVRPAQLPARSRCAS